MLIQERFEFFGKPLWLMGYGQVKWEQDALHEPSQTLSRTSSKTLSEPYPTDKVRDQGSDKGGFKVPMRDLFIVVGPMSSPSHLVDATSHENGSMARGARCDALDLQVLVELRPGDLIRCFGQLRLTS
jgi:hypothetical protein